MNTARVLIVGGYGHVGSLVAQALVRQGHRIVIAGRDGARAEQFAATLGASGVRLDLSQPSEWDAALSDLTCVLVCIDQAGPAFARRVLERGIDYVDITASDHFFQSVEALAPIALATGATALLSVGLAPGLTNLLVAQAAARLDSATSARIALQLGLGEEHGRAAIDWMLNELAVSSTAPVFEAVQFKPDGQLTPAGPFGFADQHVVRRTLGLRSATTLLSIESAFWTRVLFASRRLMRIRAIRRLTAFGISRLNWGSENCALAVEVRGQQGGKEAVVRAGFSGQREAHITAQVTARVIEELPRVRKPGVFHTEQLFSLEHLRDSLESSGGALWLSENTP
jgi:saccharopine dehydrogenase (NAD+, L-lysine-forming)